MRVSEAALALITRINAQGETEYLTQWNEAWQAYSLVGGHVEAGETFRECCVREAEEELKLLSKSDFRVASEAVGATYEYDDVSKAAGVMTHYRIQLFSIQILTDEAAVKIDCNPENCWLTSSEVFTKIHRSGKAVADQVERVLRHFDAFERVHS